MTPTEQLNHACELLENLLGCFIKRGGHWYETKTNDAEWVEVNEDLQSFLEETSEFVDAYVTPY